MPGPVLFARYALGPNRLGLCGPEDWRALLELGAAAGNGAETSAARGWDGRAASEVDRALRELAAGFEGAYPYLQLIARANGLADPLDRRVVEAYWIGNELSDGVPAGMLLGSLDARFRARVARPEWAWLAVKPELGARPTHAFHVLDVFPRVGLMGGGTVDDTIGLMDACRIRWGRVVGVDGESLLVEAARLEMREGRLALGRPTVERARRWLEGLGFVSGVAVGDVVSLHWDWACEVLAPARLAALVSRTLHQLDLANRTI